LFFEAKICYNSSQEPYQGEKKMNSDSIYGIALIISLTGCVIHSCLKVFLDKNRIEKESELDQLNALYMSELAELGNKKAQAEKERKKATDLIADFQKCTRAIKGERINIYRDGYLLCDLTGRFEFFSIFHIHKGSRIVISKKDPVIRHGVCMHECVYVEVWPKHITEDYFESYAIKPKGLKNNIRFHIAEEEVLRLKIVSMIFRQTNKIGKQKLDQMMEISKRAP